MATVKSQPQPANSAPGKSLKQCRDCGATRFQGPYQRGEIVNGQFVPAEELWQCVHCHHVAPVGDLLDHDVPVIESVV